MLSALPIVSIFLTIIDLKLFYLDCPIPDVQKATITSSINFFARFGEEITITCNDDFVFFNNGKTVKAVCGKSEKFDNISEPLQCCR